MALINLFANVLLESDMTNSKIDFSNLNHEVVPRNISPSFGVESKEHRFAVVCGVNASLISFSVQCFVWLSVDFISDPINVFRQECQGIRSGLAVMLLYQSILALEFVLSARCGLSSQMPTKSLEIQVRRLWSSLHDPLSNLLTSYNL